MSLIVIIILKLCQRRKDQMVSALFSAHIRLSGQNSYQLLYFYTVDMFHLHLLSLQCVCLLCWRLCLSHKKRIGGPTRASNVQNLGIKGLTSGMMALA